ncbi:MAG TPA: gamma-glutamylcyclotransferase [Stellaceae bacterium]|nr:gamma-glutamylcyclotransferase [Stellaceae bacterium]
MMFPDAGRIDPARAYVSVYPVDPMPPAIAALRGGGEPVWIFAYGSLMWNPDFDFAESRPAFLYGYHRSFCLYSRDYRGTPEQPGLVLGLDRGGSCHGIAYLLPPDRVGEMLDRIWAREMTGRVYEMRPVALRTAAGKVRGHACVVRRESSDYAGRLSAEEAARLLAAAVGGRGTGRDYLANTVRHLEELGIHDALLHRIKARVAELCAQIPGTVAVPSDYPDALTAASAA